MNPLDFGKPINENEHWCAFREILYYETVGAAYSDTYSKIDKSISDEIYLAVCDTIYTAVRITIVNQPATDRQPLAADHQPLTTDPLTQTPNSNTI
jgi:hypothetical protein